MPDALVLLVCCLCVVMCLVVNVVLDMILFAA